jgi:hypothetical protein
MEMSEEQLKQALGMKPIGHLLKLQKRIRREVEMAGAMAQAAPPSPWEAHGVAATPAPAPKRTPRRDWQTSPTDSEPQTDSGEHYPPFPVSPYPRTPKRKGKPDKRNAPYMASSAPPLKSFREDLLNQTFFSLEDLQSKVKYATRFHIDTDTHKYTHTHTQTYVITHHFYPS